MLYPISAVYNNPDNGYWELRDEDRNKIEGNKTAVPVQWNVREMEGVTVDHTGTADFDEPGTYHIQAVYQDCESNWATVTATEGRKLDKITFEEPEDGATTVEVTGETDKILQDNNHIREENHSIKVELDTYLEYFDQYGNTWDGQIPEVTFALADKTDGATLDGNVLTLTKAGTYQIQAAADGYEINTLTLQIDEWGEEQDKQQAQAAQDAQNQAAQSDQSQADQSAPDTNGDAGDSSAEAAPDASGSAATSASAA